MEEKQVTIEGITHKLPAPFVVLAQNPIEQEGIHFPQMDVLMKMSMGYQTAQKKSNPHEKETAGKDNHDVEQVTSPKKVATESLKQFMLTLHSVIHCRNCPAH